MYNGEVAARLQYLMLYPTDIPHIWCIHMWPQKAHDRLKGDHHAY